MVPMTWSISDGLSGATLYAVSLDSHPSIYPGGWVEFNPKHKN